MKGRVRLALGRSSGECFRQIKNYVKKRPKITHTPYTCKVPFEGLKSSVGKRWKKFRQGSKKGIDGYDLANHVLNMGAVLRRSLSFEKF